MRTPITTEGIHGSAEQRGGGPHCRCSRLLVLTPVLPSPPMTDAQLLLMIGVPAVVNILLIAGLCLHENRRLARSSMPWSSGSSSSGIGPSSTALERHLAAREAILRSEIRRVEELLTVRIEHLERR